jgi:hypothetical protein
VDRLISALLVLLFVWLINEARLSSALVALIVSAVTSATSAKTAPSVFTLELVVVNVMALFEDILYIYVTK